MRALRLYLVGHWLAIVAEWASLIGLLVAVHEEAGAAATGAASIATLVPHVLLTAGLVRVTSRLRPAVARALCLQAQALGYGVAAAAIAAGLPVAVAVVAVAVAFGGVVVLRPSGAVLLPSLARTSRELTTANLRVGQLESASVLVGPLLATVLLAVGGGSAVLAGCALLATAAAGSALALGRVGPAARRKPAPVPVERPTGTRRIRRALRAPIADLVDLVRSGGGSGALGAAVGQYVVIGAFDVLLVVIAAEHLDLGEAGAGILTTAFGLGAVASIPLSHRIARQPRVAVVVLVCLAVVGVAVAALGASLTVVTAFVVLPAAGCCRSLVDVLARLLLQRSVPPSELGGLFGALETGSGLGILVGSGLAQLLIAVSGAPAALVVVGGGYVVLAVALRTPLRRADDEADVPVVAMTKLAALDTFEPLQTPALEAVARSATELPVEPSEVVVRAGDRGDRYYVICDGRFDVDVGGRRVRSLGPGDGFGEVALLADVPRTATVTSRRAGTLLAVDREPFLVAVTGVDASLRIAWEGMRDLVFDAPIEAGAPA